MLLFANETGTGEKLVQGCHSLGSSAVFQEAAATSLPSGCRAVAEDKIWLKAQNQGGTQYFLGDSVINSFYVAETQEIGALIRVESDRRLPLG